ncbi:RNA polymerase sigma factor [Flavobacterium cerinum]|uniref:Sigma-70 family RNA polymerase sigma factor n=1 Tax=Flavobacterium cerinum TaxID=2502784 RepID=A0ABY5IY12_9FLAO|nr:sigma-70 family RNA polymerase sigma factor [Flavobacterium cerinum]UUC46234.1 sigma-70 family RNA polymerase sigma factor [Flavobacterium cerinum]
MSFEQLIYDCRNNDRKAQEQLYKLLSQKLYAVCLKYSRNYAEAEDNLQDGFILLFNKIDQYHFKGSFEGWAKRLMINNILQKYRNQGVYELVNDNIIDNNPTVDFDDEDVSLDYLISIIHELPDRYRLVFNLYVMDDYSHKEIAEMLNITIGTSKSNLARARMILKEKIESQQHNRQAVPSIQ